jgi:hypothetical protein
MTIGPDTSNDQERPKPIPAEWRSARKTAKRLELYRKSLIDPLSA